MSLRWGWRCVSCHHRKDAHWLLHGPCGTCYCVRYTPPWWVSFTNAFLGRSRDR